MIRAYNMKLGQSTYDHTCVVVPHIINAQSSSYCILMNQSRSHSMAELRGGTGTGQGVRLAWWQGRHNDMFRIGDTVLLDVGT